ncbi:MAG TPA: DNA-binding protein [Allosphingosinicella sp.]|jgi:hypothetical protein
MSLESPPVQPVHLVPEPVKIMILPSGKVDRANAAKALGRSSKTLSEWKRLGIGPRSQTISGRAFYDWEEVLAFGRGEAA